MKDQVQVAGAPASRNLTSDLALEAEPNIRLASLPLHSLTIVRLPESEPASLMPS